MSTIRQTRPIPPERRATLERWTDGTVRAYEHAADGPAFWKLVQGLVRHRNALKAEAPDLDAKVAAAAEAAHVRIYGKPSWPVPPPLEKMLEE